MADHVRLYVLAANAQDFKVWCMLSGFSTVNPNVLYVSQPDILYGVHAPKVCFILYETWHRHPRAMEIYEVMQVAINTYESGSQNEGSVIH